MSSFILCSFPSERGLYKATHASPPIIPIFPSNNTILPKNEVIDVIVALISDPKALNIYLGVIRPHIIVMNWQP